MSLANDSSKTFKVIIIKVGTVTASDMRMHHVLTILTLTFIQGHTDQTHESNKCLIITETIQAMPIKYAVKTVRLRVHITIACVIIIIMKNFNRSNSHGHHGSKRHELAQHTLTWVTRFHSHTYITMLQSLCAQCQLSYLGINFFF